MWQVLWHSYSCGIVDSGISSISEQCHLSLRRLPWLSRLRVTESRCWAGDSVLSGNTEPRTPVSSPHHHIVIFTFSLSYCHQCLRFLHNLQLAYRPGLSSGVWSGFYYVAWAPMWSPKLYDGREGQIRVCFKWSPSNLSIVSQLAITVKSRSNRLESFVVHRSLMLLSILK